MIHLFRELWKTIKRIYHICNPFHLISHILKTFSFLKCISKCQCECEDHYLLANCQGLSHRMDHRSQASFEETQENITQEFIFNLCCVTSTIFKTVPQDSESSLQSSFCKQRLPVTKESRMTNVYG